MKDSVLLESINSEDAIKANGGMLYSSCKMNPKRKSFFEDLNKMNFEFVVNKYTTKPSLSYRIITKLKNYGIIPSFMIKKSVKRIR